MSYFGYKYIKIRPTKKRRQEPEFNKKFGKQKDNNAIFQRAVYEILLQEKEKLNLEDETHDSIDDEVDEDELYKIDKMSRALV